MRTLDFKTAELITFEELKLSLDERMVSTKPLNGIVHTELIERLGDISSILKPTLKEIYVSNTGPSKTPGVSIIPYIEEIKGKGAMEAHVFRRLITSYEFDHDNADYNMKLAISYHQGGIDVALGANVRVCSNLSIFGYENMVSAPRVPIDKLFEIVSDWIHKYEEKVELVDSNMQLLKNTEFSLDNCFQFIGLMTGIRVEKDSTAIRNYINDSKVYGLNQSQISKFTENALISFSNNSNRLSAYDIYNIGTELQKPKTMDISNIIPQNVEFGQNLISFINNKLVPTWKN